MVGNVVSQGMACLSMRVVSKTSAITFYHMHVSKTSAITFAACVWTQLRSLIACARVCVCVCVSVPVCVSYMAYWSYGRLYGKLNGRCVADWSSG